MIIRFEAKEYNQAVSIAEKCLRWVEWKMEQE
jgi:hypothetical protein